MRFMIIVKATEEPEAGTMSGEELFAGHTLIDFLQLSELGDFEQGPAIERFREPDLTGQEVPR